MRCVKRLRPKLCRLAGAISRCMALLRLDGRLRCYLRRYLRQVPDLEAGEQALDFVGGRTRTRTLDPLIKRLLFLPRKQGADCKGNDFVVVQDQWVRCEV